MLRIVLVALSLVSVGLEARVCLTGFTNESSVVFEEIAGDVCSHRKGVLIDQGGASLSSRDGRLTIRLEDEGQVREQSPFWRFSVHVEEVVGIPCGVRNWHIADIDYDGDGQFALDINPNGRLSVRPGRDVHHISYYWKSEF